MTQMQLSIVCCLVLLISLNPLTFALPGWECRVCEDVTQTWHDHYHCAGNFLNWGDPTNMDIRGCEGPQFDCNKLAGQLKAACFSMQQQFVTEALLQRKIWETMMMTNKPYETCIALGKCADESSLSVPSPCHQAFLDPFCKHDWQCKNFTESCDESCYLCAWLIRDFPLFQETCKPDGAELPASVPLPTDEYPAVDKGSFLEVHRRNRILSRAHRVAANEKQEQQFIFGLRNNNNNRPNDAPKTRLQTGFTRIEQCFKVWNTIRTSAKARYFASWKRYVGVMSNSIDRLKGEMWDANISCKCLGKCELNRFEDLGLIEACRYEENEHKMMDYVFKNSGEIGVV